MCDLIEGQEVELVALVRACERPGPRTLRLALADRTGELAAIARKGSERLAALCEPGAVVHVTGRFGGGELAIRSLRAARADEVAAAPLPDGPPRTPAQMEADLRDLLATVQAPHLRALLDAVFGPGAPCWARFRDAPAAKRYHQAYRHGLLEHSLTVAQAVSSISATFPGIDRDVAVTGALLHDIGKLEAYSEEPLGIDLTDAGKLQGEIALGYYRVRRLIEDLPGFPSERGGRGAPHHPQPPRVARARLARRPVHARGDARPHDRQPRRPARIVRPARAGAAGRLALVGLRPGAGRRGVLRARRVAHAKTGKSGRHRPAREDRCLRWIFVAKDTEKLIRQLSLISYLMAERRPVTATEIRRDVEGYSDMTEDAFARRFYADRAELDSLGIHLSVDRPADGFSEQENYSLGPEAFFLPAIEFADAELAALQTALSLLDGEFAYAEPLRLALQQLTWGRPSPLGSPAQRAIGLGITGSAGGAELSARLAKVDTAIYRRKRIEFEYFTMQSGETALRKVDPYELLFEGGQFYLVGFAHERGEVRVFRLSRIRGKVAYATKAEHDFQRPPGFDPRDYANRIPWQLGEPRETAEIWVSDRIAWHVERNFGRYGDAHAGRRRRPRLPHPLRDRAARARLGDRLRAACPRRWARPSWPRSCTSAWTAWSSCTAASRSSPPRAAARPRAEEPERESAARPRESGGIRPERFARLVTLASVLIEAGRAGAPAARRRRLRAAADLAAGAARGRLRAQRRQLRRRRLRALRGGPADGRDRGRSRALLGHVRPPGAAAADRGARAARRDRAARRAPVRGPASARAESSSARSATSPRRACSSPTRAPTTRSPARSARRSRSGGWSSSSTTRPTRTASPPASSSRTR